MMRGDRPSMTRPIVVTCTSERTNSVLRRSSSLHAKQLHASPVLKDGDPFGRAHVWTLQVGDFAPCGQMDAQHRASELVTSSLSAKQWEGAVGCWRGQLDNRQGAADEAAEVVVNSIRDWELEISGGRIAS
jgi:hypothetical protein